MSEFVKQQVDFLNVVFDKSLNECSPQASQPSQIKLPLFPHQRACLHEMVSRVQTPSFIWGNQSVFSKIGILGDKNNSGKTLTALSFLAQDQENPINIATQQLNPSSNPFFFSIESYQGNLNSQNEQIIVVNVIIVPPQIFYQWKKTIENYTTLKVFTVDTKSNLSGIQQIPHNSIFLVNSRLFKNFNLFSKNKNLQYKYFFIDEASYIFLSSNDPLIEAGYIWLITSDWFPLISKNPIGNVSQILESSDSSLHPEFIEFIEKLKTSYQVHGINSAYIKNYMPFYHDARYAMIIRSTNKFIETFLPRRPEFQELITCRPSFNRSSINSFFNLQGNMDKIADFVPYICYDLNIMKFSAEEIIQQDFSGNCDLFMARIQDDCSICLDTPKQKVLTPCCHRVYCASCLLKNCFSRSKCPTCRTSFDISAIKIIKSNDFLIQKELKNKNETLLKYLCDFSGNRTIVYSIHQNLYYNIKDKLDSVGLRSDILECSVSTNQKKLKDFQDKKYNILFISDVLLLQLHGIECGFVDCIILANEILYSDLRNILLNPARKGYGCKHIQSECSTPLKIVNLQNILE